MPEKLACIKEMPPPKTPKEVKQFLGLIGYYRKFSDFLTLLDL